MNENDATVTVWAVSGLEKVLPFAAPPAAALDTIELAGAAGECEVAQVAVHACGADVTLRQPTVPALEPADAQGAAVPITARFVELVPVRYPTQGVPREDLVAVAPGYFPDPLCLESTMIVPAGQTRSIWLLFEVPEHAAGGRYQGNITVLTSAGESVIEVQFTVWPFTLPRSVPFAVTNWIWPGIMAKHHCVELYSEPFWEMLELYAADMAAHRQNVILTHIVGADGIIGIIRKGNGEFAFDFSLFDRWVTLFLGHGFRFIEGSHIFDNSVRFVRVTDAESGDVGIVTKRSHKDRIFDDDEYLTILKALLAALRDHVRDRGWSEHYIQHIFDEPAPGQIQNYLTLVKLVRSIWPELRLVDAMGCETSLFEAADIIVPLLGTEPAFQAKAQYEALGKSFWMYTCNWPRGRFPNRYIDQPLIMTRLLPWICRRYGISGYLHWAYARWSPHHTHKRLDFDPYTGLTADDTLELMNPWADTVLGGTWSCPPGDACMVYPPRDPLSDDPWILSPDLPKVMEQYLAGTPPPPAAEHDTGESLEDRHPVPPGVVDSIRWEQMREGIEDYALLWLLSERIRDAAEDAARADAARRAKCTLDAVLEEVVPDWHNYTRDPAVLADARARIAAAIVSLAPGQ